MNTKRWVALVAAAVLIAFSMGLNAMMAIFKTNFLHSFDTVLPMSGDIVINESVLEHGDGNKRIALLTVNGTIQDLGSGNAWTQVEYDHQLFMNQLEIILVDESIQAVVLAVNSPGGGVIESAAIHKKLLEIKEQRQIPIYVSMGTMAASGGYYIAAPSDKIFALKETITGSIGVIMQGINYSELAEKLGVKFETIKSGPHKDMFGGSRETSEEELAMLQEMIDEMYEEFVDIVEAGRGMSEADVKKVADGRILGGTQALKAGLVDEIGTLDDTIASIRADFDLEEAELFEYAKPEDSLAALFGMKVGSMFGPSLEERFLTRILTTHNAPRAMYLYGDF
ncbi:signal peptide peptidase SppA [Metasolibacillus meyeri]|uniref:signal peptide peptidase SppA n=1 Tax=Metasolibacillus meyeri TaxID=1071052 RepID=UPI000D2F9893|nr:signal peptide peptidase SppA [Metasolibacillus meyeri]